MAQRFKIIFLLIIALFAGLGLQKIQIYFSSKFNWNRRGYMGVSILILFILLDLLSVSVPIWYNAFPIPPLKVERQQNFVQIDRLPSFDKNGFISGNHAHSSWGAMFPAVLSNLGTIQGYESANIPVNAKPKNSPDYKGEVFIEGTPGEVKIIKWTPNRLLISYHVSQEGLIIINQNFYKGWRTRSGETVRSFKGLMAIKVTPDKQNKWLELYYFPLSFLLGLIVTMGTIGFGILSLLNQKLRGKT
ncbi:MAG: hypothetical protein HY787_24700 [Deltaproteobacteria bacterium]|nr:hypothetical protein [Deltaproteobacteria bacterium]